MKTQHQSVLDAIMAVKGELTKDLSKSEHNQVAEIVTSEIEEGICVFSDNAKSKYDTTEKKYKYVQGMVNNWLRKSEVLNGGVKYVPSYKKGPQKSETLKAIEALAKEQPDNEEVQKALEAQRKLETKVKQDKKINVDALPEHLKKFVS